MSLNFDSYTESATQSRINRASEILLSSLRTSSLKQAIEARDNDVNHFDINKLKQELSEARSNLKELESDYKLLQVFQGKKGVSFYIKNNSWVFIFRKPANKHLMNLLKLKKNMLKKPLLNSNKSLLLLLCYEKTQACFQKRIWID